MSNYISQCGQDRFVDEYFRYKDGGVFIEIGAVDGLDMSNTLFLERTRNWRGLCVEPHPKNFEKLIRNRVCICENYAIDSDEIDKEFLALEGYPLGLSGLISHYDPRHKKRIEREVVEHNATFTKQLVRCIKLQTLLDRNKVFDVDYCSIDVEGAEIDVLKSIDFLKSNIKLFTIENNFQNSEADTYMGTVGYKLLCKLGSDDVFVKE